MDLWGPDGCLVFQGDRPEPPPPEVDEDEIPLLFGALGCLSLQDGARFEIPSNEARQVFSEFRRDHPAIYRTLAAVAVERERAEKLTTQNGAAGEARAIGEMENWIPRPKGLELQVLLSALEDVGAPIKKSSFDAIALPPGRSLDLRDPGAVRAALPDMTFVEIKTCNQKRAKEDFSGFLFSVTEGEIAAAEVLGERHCVALCNKLTGNVLITTIADILQRATSATLQVTVQL